MPKRDSRNPHRSFRLTYREEIHDGFTPPKILTHIGETFSLIFKNWKIFAPLLFMILFVVIIFVGLLSEDSISTIKSTIESKSDELNSNGGELGSFASAGLLLISTVASGGLNSTFSEGQGLILIIAFLVIFLTSIYVVRFRLANKKISLRDTLYNSMTPAIATFAMILVVLLDLIPIVILIIFYSAALKTEFLTTPFYALLFLVFAIFMIILSLYLVSSSIIALVATTAPGVYPSTAISTSRSLIHGRRLKLSTRLIALILVVALIFVIVMLPVILIDSAIKSALEITSSLPVISFFLLFCTFFSFLFASIYLYLFYRSLLDYKEGE